MKVEFISSWKELDALSEEWNELLQNSTNDSIFQTWEWVNSWRATVETTYAPMVAICRAQGGELLGVAAFYICQYKLASFVDYKVLRAFGEPHSGLDYPGLLCRHGHPEVPAVIFEALAKNATGWDALWIPTSRTWGSYFDDVRRSVASTKGLIFRHRDCTFTHRTLPAECKDVYDLFSKSKKNILKRTEKKIVKGHTVNIHREAVGEELQQQLNELFRLHELRWRSVGEPGAFIRRPRLKEFYEKFVPLAREKNWLRLHLLEVDNTFVAAQIGYRYKDCYFSVQEGFDPDGIAGSGNYLRMMVMQDCIQEGIKEYDFLAGPSEHKRSWGGLERQGADIFILRASRKNKLVSLSKCWPGGRLLKEVVWVR